MRTLAHFMCDIGLAVPELVTETSDLSETGVRWSWTYDIQPDNFTLFMCEADVFDGTKCGVSMFMLLQITRDGSVFPVSQYQHQISCRPWLNFRIGVSLILYFCMENARKSMKSMKSTKKYD